jgi:hypothetical protein
MQWCNCEDLIWAQKENSWTFYAWSNSENATILHKDKIGMIDRPIHMQKQKSVGYFEKSHISKKPSTTVRTAEMTAALV